MLFPKPSKKKKMETPKLELPYPKTMGKSKTQKEKVGLRGHAEPKQQAKIKGDVVVYTDPGLLEHVRILPCLLCEEKKPGSDPHHIFDRVGHKRGIDLVVPLCREHHSLIEDKHLYLPSWAVWYGLSIWEEYYGIDLLTPAIKAIVTTLTERTPTIDP